MARIGIEWREVVRHPGYDVSSQGNVRSWRARGVPLPRPLSQQPHPDGYLTVRLASVIPGKFSTRRVHALVAEAFIGPRPVGMEVAHSNGIASDNRVGNLSYKTPGENERDKVAHGTHNMASRSHCPQGHEYAGANLIRRAGRRICRACANARSLAYRHANLATRREFDRQKIAQKRANERRAV